MKFDIYCDESRPDLLTSARPGARFALIGGLWLPTECRDAFKQEIHALRDRHRVGGEFKWTKVSPSRVEFYREVVDWFFAKGDQLRFRCIAIRHDQVNWHLHGDDQELGFYKFYYQLLHHWIDDFNEYTIFCDFKRNRVRTRLHTLQRVLSNANLSARVTNVQSVPSHESVLIQLADVLTGAASARMNDVVSQAGAKSRVLTRIEQRLGRSIRPTWRDEQKFNLFQIRLDGGW